MRSLGLGTVEMCMLSNFPKFLSTVAQVVYSEYNLIMEEREQII